MAQCGLAGPIQQPFTSTGVFEIWVITAHCVRLLEDTQNVLFLLTYKRNKKTSRSCIDSRKTLRVYVCAVRWRGFDSSGQRTKGSLSGLSQHTEVSDDGNT